MSMWDKKIEQERRNIEENVNFVAKNCYQTSTLNQKFDHINKRKFPVLSHIINQPKFSRESGITRKEQIKFLIKYLAILRYHSQLLVAKQSKIPKHSRTIANEKCEIQNTRKNYMDIAIQDCE